VQPFTNISIPRVPVAFNPVEQLSVTLAVPKAAEICAAVGLHPKVPGSVIVITGARTSLV
jgi:hypothetical protein